MTPEQIEKINRTAALPDDCIIDDQLSALMLDMSIWTLRRNNPVPAVQLSARKRGRRLGDLRKRIRGELAPSAA
ncbi:hypothetical protein ABIF65_003292 [Bradyrhizobium japonicum]|uniref:hypothetical protein n=1 Tax=Bradyrhizobium TaxID=374 RepID=UPI001BA9D83D|nr:MULTISPECIES: hypothetical protein [Bradyrhizobium]MBR0945548.1 hypothetical protein [Bradyrhizobium liaoningense]MBR1032263.1 hypothetical protein [Bradyrhizobium liaoningense]MBR1070834.1 hypothetical protein [Bradyrhizobium liaoningense]MCP1779926.1 hypothetical protein [Bradyrhizobium japonicum]MCP1957080.1 hypothetical protein [Bradyrhizobium japonicum]